MRPMSEFDPKLPSRFHECVIEQTLVWLPEGADEWRKLAKVMPNGTVQFDGMIFDGWEPADLLE